MTTTEAVRAIPEWEKEFDLQFPFAFHSCTHSQDGEKIKAYINELLTTREAEAYKQGQMNPRVGFLRQYLNEDPVPNGGEMWTDEILLKFLRIPFTTNPKETSV